MWWGLELSGVWAVLAGLVLLPGVVAVLIRDSLVETEPRGIQHLFVNAAIFDVGIYLCLLVFSPLGLTPYPVASPFNIMTAVAAFLFAVFLGAVSGIGSSRGVWQRILFSLKWTKKGPKNAWVDGFQGAEEAGAWAYVHLKDGRKVLGMPKYYSANGEKAAVYLIRGPKNKEPVKIYDQQGKNPIPQPGPGVLITPAAEITLISFLDPLLPD